jgi:hypothetical protein
VRRRSKPGRDGAPRAAASPTYRQLYAQARRKGLRGRSRMNKQELSRHLRGGR